MPRLSRWFVRAALLYQLLGFSFGGLILFHKGVPFYAEVWRLLPAHIEFMLFGWTAQLAMGVAFWILPRFGGGASRGNEKAAWLAFALINAGVWLVAIGPVAPAWVTALGRLCELAAAASFGAHLWPRIKPVNGFGTSRRESVR
ncbi:MAG: hypothetical protein HY259_11365 [Chloroflexi bacterium]|nr:hypothetical protein [Chloroflexota bacterium]MBI3734035.1 hypothetical protein [Chloroflexota bacterium]